MELIKRGTILWWSERDKNGIIVDQRENEFYFDSSVLNSEVRDGIAVTFEHNKDIKDCLCARNVQKETKHEILNRT